MLVYTGLSPPKSMGYIRGLSMSSWCEEEEHWRACGQPLTPEHHEDDFGEVCLRHPGDRPEEDTPEGEVDEDLNDRFAPLTTKASELVCAIHFVGATLPHSVALRSAYQMQLQLRVDPVRQLLVYDCYEFVPDALFKDWTGPTNRDLREIEKASEGGLFGDDRGGGWSDYGSDSSDEMGEEEDDDEPADGIPSDEHRNWFTKKLYQQFQHSRVYRLRIPFGSVVRIRTR